MAVTITNNGRANMPETPRDGLEHVDVTGPLFLSYRHNDGAKLVASLAWLLRAAGVPVWRDMDDLPPGDTADRLAQALADGLSGGVLVVTPDAANSPIIKSIEAPELIRQHLVDTRFQLLIINAANDASSDLDYGAPDRILDRVKKELQGVHQYRPTDEGLLSLVETAVKHRMTQHREIVAANGCFELSVQTRNVGQVYDRTGAQLDIRTRRSFHERLPSPEGLEDLRRTLGQLPDAVVTTGAREVKVTGGAHLSVGFAIGAALPSSRVGVVTVVDQRNAEWRGDKEAAFPTTPSLSVAITRTPAQASGRPRVVVYMDLLSTTSDDAIARFLTEHEGEYVAHAEIRRLASGLIDPHDAAQLASEGMAVLKQFSADNMNAVVDLFLRCPFPVSVLLGRLSNTLRFRLYEWNDEEIEGDFRARYAPILDVHASAPAGPITQVLLLPPEDIR